MTWQPFCFGGKCAPRWVITLVCFYLPFNSFTTASRSQRIGLHTVAYGNPLTAALYKWCYFVRQMGALLQVNQSHGLTYHCTIYFSEQFCYCSISFSGMNYLMRRPDLLRRCHNVSKWRPPVTVHLRLERKRHLVGHVGQDRNCVVCSTNDKRRRINFVCTGSSSKPHLHPKECFAKYHS